VSDIPNDKVDPAKTATSTLDREKDDKAKADKSKEDPSLKTFETHPGDASDSNHADILSEQSQFHTVPPAGQVDSSVTAIQAQSDRGSGVSPARPYTVVTKEGSVDGLMYTNSTGSTFKSLDGVDAYKVEFQKDGKVNLEPQNQVSKPISDAQLQRSVNPLNDNGDSVPRPRAAPPEAPAPPPERVKNAEPQPTPTEIQPGGAEVKVKAPVEQTPVADPPPPPLAPLHQAAAATAPAAADGVGRLSPAGNDLNFAPAQAGSAGGASAEQQQRRTEQAAAPLVVAQQFQPENQVPKKEPVEEVKDKSTGAYQAQPPSSQQAQNSAQPSAARTTDRVDPTINVGAAIQNDGTKIAGNQVLAARDGNRPSAVDVVAKPAPPDQPTMLKGSVSNVPEVPSVTPVQRATADPGEARLVTPVQRATADPGEARLVTPALRAAVDPAEAHLVTPTLRAATNPAEAHIVTPAQMAAINAADARLIAPSQRAALDATATLQPAEANRLQQFGLDARDPQTAAFLIDARRQLMSVQHQDGTPQNLTLADGLKGLNQQQADRLAAFLMHNPEATADKVILNNSLLARLNVMYVTDKTAAVPGQPLTSQRPGQLDLATAAGAPDYLALRRQALMPPPGSTEGSLIPSQTNVRELALQQVMLQNMGDFLRNQNLADRQTMANSGLLYTELNRILTASNNPPDAGKSPLVLGDLLRGTLGTPPQIQSFVLRGENLVASGRLDQLLPSRVDALAIARGPIANDAAGAVKIGTAVHDAATQPVKIEPGTAPLLTPDQVQRALDAANIAKGKPVDANAAAVGKVDASKVVKDPNAATDAAKGKAVDPHQDGISRMTDAMIAASKDGKVADVDLKLDEPLSEKQKQRSDELDEHGQPKKKPEANAVPDQKVDAALMALMAARKLKEDKDLKEKEDQQEKDKKKKEDSQRRKYIVKEKDTLESIALKQCRDVRMAALIFEINQEVLQKNVDADTKDARELLVPGTIIWLPSVDEMQEFRVKLVSAAAGTASGEKPTAEEELAIRFGQNWSGGQAPEAKAAPGPDFRVSLLAAAVEASKKRRENVENLLGPLAPVKEEGIRYVVRLGDSLKSIAMKHPGVQDVSLWELLAQINNISTECDARGIPLEKLSRGMKIRIPNLQEIADFREQNKKADSLPDATAGGVNKLGSTTLTLPAQLIPPEKTDAASKMLSAGGFDNKTPAIEPKPELTPAPEKPTITAAEIDNQVTPLSKGKAIENIRKLSDDCRIVRRHLANADGSRCYQAQLDILVRNAWQTVIVYNISDNDNWCKRLGVDGSVEKEQLNMPVPVIHQTLENDFSSNWQDYRDQFII
jgi:hypothetical protein